jgi:hypothetical protein
MVKVSICESLRIAGERHNFDAEEEIIHQGVSKYNIHIKEIKKEKAEKSKAEKSKAEKVVKEKVVKEKVVKYPMPFMPNMVDNNLCHALVFNRGLFTQCPKKPMDSNSVFCSACQTDADKNSNGIPNCGTIQQRLATGLYEFKDNKGRSPISYIKILENLKITLPDNIRNTIPPEHFNPPMESPKKTKGRPKKTTIVETDQVNDLFANIIAEQQQPIKQEQQQEIGDVPAEGDVPAKEAKKKAKKAEHKQDIGDVPAEGEVRGVRGVPAKEAKKKQQEDKKAEQEAKKKQQEAKKAEQEAKKATKKNKEEVKQEVKEEGEVRGVRGVPAKEGEVRGVRGVPAKEVKPVPIKVRSITIGDKQYKIATTNEAYDPKTKELVGIYNPETNTIEKIPDEDIQDDEDEEEEDEEEEVGTDDENQEEEYN